MSKAETGPLKKIKISDLKKMRYLRKGFIGGKISWTRHGEDNGSVGAQTTITETSKYLRIYYTQTDNYSGVKKEFDYNIPIVSTTCNYGGERFWFICPWYVRNIYCGRRVAVLFKNGDHFACRHCSDVIYSSQKLSGYEKRFGTSLSYPELDEMRQNLKRFYYKGKPTKKYLRYLREEERLETSFRSMALHLTRKLDGMEGLETEE
jgi:hypothetical protein